MSKSKKNPLDKIMQYLFAYNSFQKKLQELKLKQKKLLLESINKAEDQKTDIIRNQINQSF